MKSLRKILSKIFVAVLATVLVTSAFGATANLPMGDIGDHGTWATENNREKLLTNITHDVEQFSGDFQNQLVRDYVPLEAKIGLAFMNALSFISDILDSSLVRFVILFMFIAFAFWIAFETYNTMKSGKGDIPKLLLEIVKKGTVIAVWVIILCWYICFGFDFGCGRRKCRCRPAEHMCGNSRICGCAHIGKQYR